MKTDSVNKKKPTAIHMEPFQADRLDDLTKELRVMSRHKVMLAALQIGLEKLQSMGTFEALCEIHKTQVRQAG